MKEDKSTYQPSKENKNLGSFSMLPATPERGESEDTMANNINEINGITNTIRRDSHELAAKLSMAITMEDEFINGCYAIMNRFYSSDKSCQACRMACYNLAGTENYYEMANGLLPEHERKLRKLKELQSFVSGWERDFR